MDGLIEKQQVLDLAEEWEGGYGGWFEIRFDELEEELKAMPAKVRWIPVTEALPDDYMTVHVTIVRDGKRVVVDSYYNAGSKCFARGVYTDYKDGEVLAWMPWFKPEPWKGE